MQIPQHPLSKREQECAQALLDAATAVRENAYAPYSHKRVGAAIFTRQSGIYVGCNIECADGGGTHAVAAAVCMMVAAGDLSPLLLTVVGGAENATSLTFFPSCDRCNQQLWEFSQLSGFNLHILWGDERGQLCTRRLSDLVPSVVGPENSGVDLAAHRR